MTECQKSECSEHSQCYYMFLNHYSSEYILVLCSADREWHMVFKAVTGVSSPDPYDLWVSSTTDGFMPNYSPTCQHPEGSGIDATHCKTYSILDWEDLDIEEVNYWWLSIGRFVILRLEKLQHAHTHSNTTLSLQRAHRIVFVVLTECAFFKT